LLSRKGSIHHLLELLHWQDLDGLAGWLGFASKRQKVEYESKGDLMQKIVNARVFFVPDKKGVFGREAFTATPMTLSSPLL